MSLTGLTAICSTFSQSRRLYYGHDPRKAGSLAFLSLTRKIFGRSSVITKPLQLIRTAGSQESSIAKANFDVEIAVDAILRHQDFDAFVLMSGDADFAYLLEALRLRGKQTMVVRGGYIARNLRQAADFVVDGSRLREALITRKPR